MVISEERAAYGLRQPLQPKPILSLVPEHLGMELFIVEKIPKTSLLILDYEHALNSCYSAHSLFSSVPLCCTTSLFQHTRREQK
jgi:hypothetical protein